MSTQSQHETVSLVNFNLETTDKQQVSVRSWIPKDAPIALIHLLHGMAEHKQRYSEIAYFLAEQGIQVFAHDHRGHGESTDLSGVQGHYGDQNGLENVINDIEVIQTHIHKQHPNTAKFLLGHSMGSFLAQYYLMNRPNFLKGVILTGTSYTPRLPVLALNLVAKIEKLRLGANKSSKLINAASFGSYNNAFKPNRTEFDWLSRDPKIVDDYINDEQCGFICTNETWSQFSSALLHVHSQKNAKKMNPKVPMLLLCGDKDPVGSFGKGAKALKQFWNKTGIDAELQLTPDARHEILNETNRQEIYTNLLSWIKKTAL